MISRLWVLPLVVLGLAASVPAAATNGFKGCFDEWLEIEMAILEMDEDMPRWSVPAPSPRTQMIAYSSAVIERVGAAFRVLGRSNHLTAAQKNEVWDYFVTQMSKWSGGRWGAVMHRAADGSYVWLGTAGDSIESVLVVTPTGDVYKGLVRKENRPPDFIPPLKDLQKLLPIPPDEDH